MSAGSAARGPNASLPRGWSSEVDDVPVANECVDRLETNTVLRAEPYVEGAAQVEGDADDAVRAEKPSPARRPRRRGSGRRWRASLASSRPSTPFWLAPTEPEHRFLDEHLDEEPGERVRFPLPRDSSRFAERIREGPHQARSPRRRRPDFDVEDDLPILDGELVRLQERVLRADLAAFDEPVESAERWRNRDARRGGESLGGAAEPALGEHAHRCNAIGRGAVRGQRRQPLFGGGRVAIRFRDELPPSGFVERLRELERELEAVARGLPAPYDARRSKVKGARVATEKDVNRLASRGRGRSRSQRSSPGDGIVPPSLPRSETRRPKRPLPIRKGPSRVAGSRPS